MNITKNISEQVASKLLSPIMTKIDSIGEEIKNIASEAILGTIPNDLLACFNKYNSMFRKSSCATLCNGKQEIRVSGIPYFPAYSDWYPQIEVGIDITEKIVKMQIKKKKLEDELEQTSKSIISTLLSLRTFKRVKENFPEAYEYLKEYEEEGNTAVALPINDILSTINKYKEK